jgi:uncharacterized protein (DUF433 family)
MALEDSPESSDATGIIVIATKEEVMAKTALDIERNVRPSRPSAKPLYIVADVARFSRASESQVRRWLQGYSTRSGSYQPFLQAAPDRSRNKLTLSFENLIEVALVSALRAKNMPIQAIRRAHEQAQKEFGPNPFAQLQVYQSGGDIFAHAAEYIESEAEYLTTLTKGGQRAWEPVLREYLLEIDWRDGWPIEWKPFRDIKLNPEIAFGLPNVSGIRTEAIIVRFMADESVRFIAEDFGLTVAEVETALRYELTLGRAA